MRTKVIKNAAAGRNRNLIMAEFYAMAALNEIERNNIHWLDVDEDLSIAGLLRDVTKRELYDNLVLERAGDRHKKTPPLKNGDVSEKMKEAV